MDDSSIISAFKHMQLPLMIVGSDGTIIHCNNGTDRVFGYGDGELIGRPVFDVLPVATVPELNAFIQAPAVDATIKGMSGLKRCGSSFQLAIHLTAWVEAENGLQHALILRDITEEVEAILSMKDKLDRANFAIASAGIGVFEYNLPENRADGSETWRTLMNLGATEATDMREALYARVHPEDVEEASERIIATIDDVTHNRCVYEYRLRSKNGLDWDWRRTDLAVSERDEQGKAIGYIGSTVDISAQKNIARILEKNAKQFRSAFENSPVAKAMTNLDQVIIRVNSAFCDLFGYPEDTIVGTKLRDHSLAEDLHIGLPELHDIQAGKISAYEIEKRYIRANGAVMWALLTVGIIDESDCHPNQYILHITDITERHRLEEFRNKFVSTVSHELRTPLTSVLGALSLLSSMPDQAFSDEVQRLLYIAQENGKRLHSLVNDILDYEKSSVRQMRFTLSEHPIIGLVEDAVLANIIFAEGYGIRFNIDCTDRSLIGTVDPKRFQQVMTNLLSNAVKFAEEGSEVDVVVQAEKDAVRVSIINDGVGIPDEFHSQIFQPFAQAADATTRERGGTGLGLNITKQILEQTGGTIDYISADDGRTTFWFTVPINVPD
ncbi:MAG: PAS domain S-box-containing protein [Candidatus Azotimanducaceae bacterium]|jgi:PAS domain S-box-containing protein